MRARIISIDIETLAAPLIDDVRSEKYEELQKEYSKEDTVQKHLEAFENEKWCFTPEGAIPICVSLCDSDGYEWVVSDKDPLVIARKFWSKIEMQAPCKLLGFNLTGFDLPVLMRYGILADCKISKPFGRYDLIDLTTVPFWWEKKGKSLKWYARNFLAGEKKGNGKDVKELWEKDPSAVEKYCLQDARLALKLYQQYSRFLNI